MQKKEQIITKITEIEKKLTDHNHDRYITTPEFNTFKAEVFDAKLARKKLITKTDFNTKLINFNKKINSSKTKIYLLKMNLRNYKNFIQF